MPETPESHILKAFKNGAEYFRVIQEFHRHHVAIGAEEQGLIDRFIGGRVLDAGCGDGSLTRWLADRHPQTLVVGTDCSGVALGMARAASAGFLPGRLSWAEANIKGLPFNDSKFDFILCHSVLEHVVDYPAALRELARVLKPGGRLVLQTSNSGRFEGGAARAVLKLLTGTTVESVLQPTLVQRVGSVDDNQQNFDVTHIWSNLLINHLKKIGLRILHFTTMRSAVWNSSIYQGSGFLRRLVIRVVYTMPIFPFTHLGPSILVGCEKIDRGSS